MELEQKIKNQKMIDKAIHYKKKMIMLTFQILSCLSVASMLFISTVYASGAFPSPPDPELTMIAFIVPTALAIIFGLLAYIFLVYDWQGFKSYAGKMVGTDKISSEMWSKWELEAFHYQESKYTQNEIKKMRSAALRQKEMEKQKELLEKELSNAK